MCECECLRAQRVRPWRVCSLLVVQILSEADLDGDQKLSYVEFEHIISRAPDFIKCVAARVMCGRAMMHWLS